MELAQQYDERRRLLPLTRNVRLPVDPRSLLDGLVNGLLADHPTPASLAKNAPAPYFDVGSAFRPAKFFDRQPYQHGGRMVGDYLRKEAK